MLLVKALKGKIEDREATINKQREEDRRERQDNLREFQKIMFGRSSYPFLPSNVFGVGYQILAL